MIIDEQDVESKMKFLENAFIMHSLGEEISMNAVNKFMINVWFTTRKGYSIIWFRSKMDKDVVLMRGPYTIYCKPVIL